MTVSETTDYPFSSFFGTILSPDHFKIYTNNLIITQLHKFPYFLHRKVSHIFKIIYYNILMAYSQHINAR